MMYGTPQAGGRDSKTKRVKVLKLWAENFADEQLLTRLEQFFSGVCHGESIDIQWRDGTTNYYLVTKEDGEEDGSISAADDEDPAG